jgi:hypothetical protein
MLLIGVLIGGAVGQTSASVPKPQDKLAINQEEVKQLLLLMDTDKNGKISSMERDKNGEPDITEPAQSRIRVSHPFTTVGK